MKELQEAIRAEKPTTAHQSIVRLWLMEVNSESVEDGEEEGSYAWGELARAGRRCGCARCWRGVTVNRMAWLDLLTPDTQPAMYGEEWKKKWMEDTEHLSLLPPKPTIEADPEFWTAIGEPEKAKEAAWRS